MIYVTAGKGLAKLIIVAAQVSLLLQKLGNTRGTGIPHGSYARHDLELNTVLFILLYSNIESWTGMIMP